MVQRTSLSAATAVLVALVLAAIFAGAALGQPSECRAAVDSQYGDCDSAPVTIVPQPEPPEPGGGGDTNTSEVGTQTINQVAETRATGARSPDVEPQVTPPAGPEATPAVAPSYPSYASSTGVAAEASQVSALPETGGVPPVLTLLAAALLLGTSVLAGRWILRR